MKKNTTDFSNMIIRSIKQKRKDLRETQKEFAERFNVTVRAVASWEQGINQAPYKVLEFVLFERTKIKVCNKCNGTGILRKRINSLTARQEQLFDFVKNYIVRNSKSPTLKEIATYMKVKNTRGIVKHLDALKRKGYILRDRRNIIILK